MVWNAISYVTSGFTLAAFLAATTAWVVVSRIRARAEEIKLASPKDRPALIGDALSYLSIDPKKMTRDQQYNIVVVQLQERAERGRMIYRFVSLAALLCFLLAIASIYFSSPSSGSRPEPSAGLAAVPVPIPAKASPQERAKSESANRLRAWILPKGAFDDARKLRLTNWLIDHGGPLRQTPVEVFLNSDEPEIEITRRKAVTGLNVPPIPFDCGRKRVITNIPQNQLNGVRKMMLANYGEGLITSSDVEPSSRYQITATMPPCP